MLCLPSYRAVGRVCATVSANSGLAPKIREWACRCDQSDPHSFYRTCRQQLSILPSPSVAAGMLLRAGQSALRTHVYRSRLFVSDTAAAVRNRRIKPWDSRSATGAEVVKD